jgi:hypothetical protein
MLRTTNPHPSLWEAILPSELLGLPAELARVDQLLDDPAFWQPFRAHFDPIIGRPSIPIETHLRMMFLKFRYRLGYELLCREVADSISWQQCCRIPWAARCPIPPPWSSSPAGLAQPPWPSSTRRCWPRPPPTRCCAPKDPFGHHRGGGQRGLSDRRRPARQGGQHPGPHHRAHPGHRRRHPHHHVRPPPRRPPPRPPTRPLAAGPHGPGQTAGRRTHRRAGRSCRPGARRRRPGGRQCPPAASPRRQPGLRQAGPAGLRPGDHDGAHQPAHRPARTRLAGGTPNGATAW